MKQQPSRAHSSTLTTNNKSTPSTLHLLPMATSLPDLMTCDSRNGFNFDLYARNAALLQQLTSRPSSDGLASPKSFPTVRKTGTTIVGLCTKDAVVLAADTRATEGPLVADKNCEKIHYIAPNMWCCGAGTSADTENSTALISSKLSLHRLSEFSFQHRSLPPL